MNDRNMTRVKEISAKNDADTSFFAQRFASERHKSHDGIGKLEICLATSLTLRNGEYNVSRYQYEMSAS